MQAPIDETNAPRTVMIDVLRAGFLLFLAKGCLWLLVGALLGDLL